MALKTYKLTAPHLLDPRWLNLFRGGRQQGEVSSDGAVVVHGLSLPFSDDNERMAPGTKVQVWISFDFVCADVAAIEREEQSIREKLAREAEATQAEKERRWAEDRVFNERLVLPVKWQTGIKDVLSGLTEKSDGSGRNRATVNHIRLLEDLHDGRLRRKAGDFLCTSASQTNGLNWSNQPYEPGGRVTCARCLALAKKWQAQ
jgi:hypothetical protein